MRPPTGLAAAAEPAGGSPASRGSSPIPAARAGTSPVPTATVAPTAGAAADGPQGPGGKGKGAMGIKELRSQPSLRRQLQRWRSMRWLSRADINLDDSISQTLLAGGGRWWQRVWRWRRSPRAIAALVVLLAVLAVAGVLLADAARLLPCIKPGATCFNLALAEFQDICDFESLPVRLTTTAFLPPLYSRLHVKEAGFEVGVRGSGQPPVGSCFFDERNAVSSMVLTGGTQNLTIDTTLHVTWVSSPSVGWIGIDVVMDRLSLVLTSPDHFLIYWTQERHRHGHDLLAAAQRGGLPGTAPRMKPPNAESRCRPDPYTRLAPPTHPPPPRW